MKKIMIFAIAAMALAACSKTFDHSKSEGAVIGFSSWTAQLTKAAREQGSSDFVGADDDFAVYGFKHRASGDPTDVTVFNGVDVNYDGTSTWDYTNHVFWDASYDSYTFYAVSPTSATTGATINAQTGAIALASITFAGNNGDVLIADKTVVLKDDGEGEAETPLTYFNSYGSVKLYFNHAASLVDIYVKKSTNLHSSDVSVQAISLDNMKNAGVLSIATDAYTGSATGRPYIPAIAIASWTNPSGSVSYIPSAGVHPVYGGNGTNVISSTNVKIIAEDTAFNPTTAATPAASTQLFNTLIVMPQTFGVSGNNASQKISISYTLGNDPTVYNRVAYLADFDIADDADQDDDKADTGFKPGKHYILYLTIDAHEISFTAEIADWEDITGYHYLIN